jgi:hypothetical protein
MKYDPASLIAELEQLQEYADDAFSDGLIISHESHPYGSTFVAEGRVDAPDAIAVDTIDDILPLTFNIHGCVYGLSVVEGGKAKYTYKGQV